VHEGYGSITPVSCDLMAREAMGALAWANGLGMPEQETTP
jgi:hypothetical protein